MDTWQLIATERGRLVDTLSELSEPDWAADSLCAGWRNRDTLAHIVSTAEITPGRFVAGMVRNGFNFNHMVASDIRRVGTYGTDQLLARLRAAVPSHNHPPGPVSAMLMETVVHGEDIAFPLGRTIMHQPEAMIALAEWGRTAQPLVGCRKRVAGLTLRATDLDWSTGAGPEVSGPVVPLMLAMCGRVTALDSLSGAGVEIMRGRM